MNLDPKRQCLAPFSDYLFDVVYVYHFGYNAALTRGPQFAWPKAHAGKGHRGPNVQLAAPTTR